MDKLEKAQAFAALSVLWFLWAVADGTGILK